MKEYLEKTRQLAAQIPLDRYDHLYGIPKSGLITAPFLRDYMNEIGHRVELVFTESEIGPRTLIVDDLIDTGSTIARLPKADVAVVYRKPHSPHVDYFTEEQSGWIYTPWEGEEEKPVSDLILRLLQFAYPDTTELRYFLECIPEDELVETIAEAIREALKTRIRN